MPILSDEKLQPSMETQVAQEFQPHMDTQDPQGNVQQFRMGDVSHDTQLETGGQLESQRNSNHQNYQATKILHLEAKIKDTKEYKVLKMRKLKQLEKDMKSCNQHPQCRQKLKKINATILRLAHEVGKHRSGPKLVNLLNDMVQENPGLVIHTGRVENKKVLNEHTKTGHGETPTTQTNTNEYQVNVNNQNESGMGHKVEQDMIQKRNQMRFEILSFTTCDLCGQGMVVSNDEFTVEMNVMIEVVRQRWFFHMITHHNIQHDMLIAMSMELSMSAYTKSMNNEVNQVNEVTSTMYQNGKQN